MWKYYRGVLLEKDTFRPNVQEVEAVEVHLKTKRYTLWEGIGTPLLIESTSPAFYCNRPMCSPFNSLHRFNTPESS